MNLTFMLEEHSSLNLKMQGMKS